MELYPNIYRTLAPGPMVELRGYAAACRLPGRLYAYLDCNGPTGTARDGLAEGMLALAAQRQGPGPRAAPDRSGQRGLCHRPGPGRADQRPPGLPGHARQHPRRPAGKNLSALGAQLLFSPAREGAAGARALARTWAEKRGWYYTDWLACDDNPEYHRG